MMQDVMEVFSITKVPLSVRKHFRIEYSPLLDDIEWQVSRDIGVCAKIKPSISVQKRKAGGKRFSFFVLGFQVIICLSKRFEKWWPFWLFTMYKKDPENPVGK